MMNKKTKIVCTMGPNTNKREMVYELAVNGMDVARLNFSHGDHEEHLNRMNLIKSVRKELNIPIAMLLDTKGPEIRTGVLKDDQKVILEQGQEFILTMDDIEGDSTRVSVTYKNMAEDLKENDVVLIDDGLIALRVKSVKDTDVICEVNNGGELGSRKGINLPGIKVKLPGLTDKDREDIFFGINQGIDFIAASFVRDAEAIRDIRRIVQDCNSDVAIIAKIENQEGITNIDEIIAEADGIMVARGDLGVEIPTEDIPFVQKMIIKKCNDAYKPVITATQMLDSMIRNPRPTRAEVTDVANAIYDGTDAIMLSGETAMGKYPIETIKMMVNIAKETEAHLEYDKILKGLKTHRSRSISSAICYSAVATAGNLNAKVIVASSFSGYTSRLVSKFRPEATILGLSPLERTLRKMQLYWGVVPIRTTEVNSTDHLLEQAVISLKESHYAEKDDVIVLTAGVPAGKTGVTNMIKVVTID